MATRRNDFCAGTSGTKPLPPLVELDGMMRGRRFWSWLNIWHSGRLRLCVCVHVRSGILSPLNGHARSLPELPIAEKIHFDWLVIIIGEISLAFALHSVFRREAKL